MNVEDANYDEYAKQLIAASRQLAGMLPDILSTLLAKPIAASSQQELNKGVKNVLKMVTEVVPKFSELKSIENRATRNYALLNLINSGLKPYLKEIPQDKSVLEFIIDFLDPRKPLPQGSYLLKTSYETYMTIVTQLAMDTVTMIPFNRFNEFLYSVFSSTEDVLSIGQTVMTKFPMIHKELSLQRKRFTKKQAERDIEYCGKLAGHFEKCISTVAGVIKLIEGEKVSYASMRRRRLASNLRTVSESEYSFLTTGFDKNIRNALAHQQWIYNPKRCTVT